MFWWNWTKLPLLIMARWNWAVTALNYIQIINFIFSSFFFFTVVCFSRFSILEMTPQHLVNYSNYVLCFVYSIRTVFGSRCYDHFHQFTMSSSGCFVQVFCIYLDQVHVFGLFRIKFGLHRNELNSFIVILLLCVLRLLFVFILFQTIFHFNHKLVGHFEWNLK